MRALVGCEFSATVRDALRARGVDAWSCDVLPCEGDPRWHIQGDVLGVLHEGWDLAIFHPPCTRLANSGVTWLHKRNLWAELDAATTFFRALLDAPIPRVAVENPIPHKYALERIGRKYDQIVQPFQFGHPERKATCFWLRGLPPLVPTNVVALPARKSEAQRLHWLPPSPDRWKLRSKTFQGIADAIAAQWGVA